jgi:hypothetical protein
MHRPDVKQIPGRGSQEGSDYRSVDGAHCRGYSGRVFVELGSAQNWSEVLYLCSICVDLWLRI